MSVQQTPRMPSTEREAYAWGYMIGYLGDIPDEMVAALSERSEGHLVMPPPFDAEQIKAYTEGYREGLDMYSSHSDEED